MTPPYSLKRIGLQIQCSLCGQTHVISQDSPIAFYECGGKNHFVGINGKSFLEEPRQYQPKRIG